MNQSPVSNQFRTTVAHIDLNALRHNLKLARACAGSGAAFLGVVKANAYGHGAVPVSRILEAEGIEALAVATPEEGIELREAGIKGGIYVFGGPFHAPGSAFQEYRLTPVLYNVEQFESLATGLSAELAVHLKIDTGMTRLGFLPGELPEALKMLRRFPRLQLNGIFTHLAQADTTSEGPTAEQYRLFSQVEAMARQLVPAAKIYHIANSAMILEGRLGGCAWARPGIMLYGANPHPRLKAGEGLIPVMRFETEIVSLKTVPRGTAVSYGGTWVASRQSRIAVLPVGYADGYIRHLSNTGHVLLRGKRVPVAGRVCMDLTMLDVTDLKDASIGDKVQLWGPGLRAEEVAELAGTISYELFCAVSKRVPRRYEGDAP